MRISDWSSDVCSSDLIACCAYLNIGGHCARSALESCMSIVDIEPLIALSVTANRSDAPRLMRRTRTIETWLMRTARSEERSVGTECVSTCRSWCSPDHSKKKQTDKTNTTQNTIV